jgi:hypothetical protein
MLQTQYQATICTAYHDILAVILDAVQDALATLQMGQE